MDNEYWIAYVIEDLIGSMKKTDLLESSVAAQELLITAINEISSKTNDRTNQRSNKRTQEIKVINFGQEKMMRARAASFAHNASHLNLDQN